MTSPRSLITIVLAMSACAFAQADSPTDSLAVVEGVLPAEVELWLDSLGPGIPGFGEEDFLKSASPKSLTLTEEDYREVAREMGVEVAAIKAVVDIEAGANHVGFWAPGKPLINFDLTMYRKLAPRRGVNLTKAQKKHPEIFARPDARRYGSQQAGQQARLDAAAGIDAPSAIESTFWGMFQIGGFNWKKCGAKSLDHFVELMSRSERDQLELFASFVRNSGMLPYIQRKQWAEFARRYNGPSYRARNYHTRLAAAYARHSKAK